MRLGVLGGTFDPVHIGHLIAAECVRDAMQLDQVIFVPAGRPPHKSGPAQPGAAATAEMRLRMVEAAIQSHIGFTVSDIEIRRGGLSYTVDTLQDISAAYPGARLYFILGADLLAELPAWRDMDRALSLATFVAVHRPGVTLSDMPPALRGIVKPLEIPGVDVSSSIIRGRVKDGKSIRYLVPAPAQDIIEEEGLYRDGRA